MNEPVTVEQLAVEMHQLRQRVADLEDAHELEIAILENRGTPLIPWGTAKSELEL